MDEAASCAGRCIAVITKSGFVQALGLFAQALGFSPLSRLRERARERATAIKLKPVLNQSPFALSPTLSRKRERELKARPYEQIHSSH